MPKRKFDVIIIGGGPAGMAAAYWCAELGLSALLLESKSELGGQLLWTFNDIHNHLGTKAKNGRELRDIFLKQIEDKEFEFRLDSHVENIDFEKKEVFLSTGEAFTCDFLVLATGVSRRILGVPGEEEFIGKGVIFSGKRDKELVRGKTVAVVGGGDAAFENVQILSETAEKVFLIHRRREFSAREEFIEAALENPKASIITEKVVRKITGGEKLEALEINDVNTGDTSVLKIDAVLIRVGVKPNSELFEDVIKLDKKGFIKTNKEGETNLNRVFAAGDIANPISPTVSTAIGTAVTSIKSINSSKSQSSLL